MPFSTGVLSTWYCSTWYSAAFTQHFRCVLRIELGMYVIQVLRIGSRQTGPQSKFVITQQTYMLCSFDNAPSIVQVGFTFHHDITTGC